MSTPPPGGPNPQPQQAPNPLTIHGQYIKDLSFENPRAPQSLIEQKQPQLNLNVNVATKQFEAKTYEVTLTIEANATNRNVPAASARLPRSLRSWRRSIPTTTGSSTPTRSPMPPPRSRRSTKMAMAN